MKKRLENYNPYEPHRWEAVVILFAATIILSILFSSCRTTKSTTDRIQENTTEKSINYKENWENDQLYIHQLESQIKEYELAGVTFKTQPCPEVKQQDGKPCPDRPANTVDISPDGSIHASGDIQSISVSKKKIQQLQEQIAASQHQKFSKDTSFFYVTRTFDITKTVTIKKGGIPWWVWVLVGNGMMLMIWLNWKRIWPWIQRYNPLFFLPVKR